MLVTLFLEIYEYYVVIQDLPIFVKTMCLERGNEILNKNSSIVWYYLEKARNKNFICPDLAGA